MSQGLHIKESERLKYRKAAGSTTPRRKDTYNALPIASQSVKASQGT